MYGVLCISGDVFDLSKEQWDIAQKGTDFYKKASPVIANGVTHMFGPFQNSNRALKDYQASVRYGTDGRALVIAHAFEHTGTLDIKIPVEKEYLIEEIYETDDHGIKINGSCLNICFEESFDAVAVLLTLEP